MADIRINSLPSTATSTASDDFIAIDGATNGTRKMSAFNPVFSGTSGITATDVILGSSGPSVKSTLSARAPRQGLVFDGTTGGSSTLASAVGASDFSIDVTFTVPTAVNYSGWGIVGIGNVGGNGTFSVYIYDSDLKFTLWGASGSDFREKILAGIVSNYAGKTVKLSVVRNASTPSLTVYLNGVAQTVTEATNGTPPTWAYSIPSTAFYVGKLTTSGNYYTGFVGIPNLYNRALSSSEVVALYEAGAPAGSDYNSASNTAINTSAWTNYLGTYTSFTGASATGFTAVKASGDAYASIVPTPVTAKGQKFRVTGTLTLNNGKTVVPGMYVDSGGATVSLTAGSFDITLTAGSAGSNLILVTTNGDADYTLANLSVTRLGLLLAPDAYQAGGGTSWYDTSGNSATITLPASGVSWNVPTSGKIATNLQINGTGDSSVAGKLGVGTTTPKAQLHVLDSIKVSNSAQSQGNIIFGDGGSTAFNVGLARWNGTTNAAGAGGVGYFSQGSANSGGHYWYVGDDAAGSTTERMRLNTSGNLLLGTTIDGGDKLQVNGNVTIGSTLTGPSTGLTITIPGSSASISMAKGVEFQQDVYLTAAKKLYIDSGSNTYLWESSADTMKFVTGGTTALTLDSSQVATFANHAQFAQFAVLKESNAIRWTADNLVGGTIRSQMYADSSGNLYVTSGGSSAALTLDSSQRCILSGALRLNNAYTAGAPTATGYVTLQDSAGNTYKVLVGT